MSIEGLAIAVLLAMAVVWTLIAAALTFVLVQIVL